MTDPAIYVVVSGPPGSGKSTLASDLAPALGLALVAKDTIKDALMDALPVPDVGTSRRLGGAAIAVMFAVAGESPVGAVLESNLRRTLAADEVAGLPGPVVEVFCRCDRALAIERYRSRAGSRHPGHFDGARADDDLWDDDVSQPVAGGWPVLEVDTSRPVDVDAVVAFVRQATGTPG
jgi:predicted kinase